MKNLWQNGKMTSLGKRVAALALALCFLASFAQNMAFKPISATEAVSGSDVAVVTESDAAVALAEPTVDNVSETDVEKAEDVTEDEETNEADVSKTDVSVAEVSETDVSESDVAEEVSDTDADYGDPKITMTTALEVGSAMSLTIEADDTVYIDWGDGNIVEYSDGCTTKGNTIKIYCDGNILQFICFDKSLSELDVSNCTELSFLGCANNKLVELDVTSNTALTVLSCGNNSLTELDITSNIALINLSCEGNNISKLDTSNNVALKFLSCDNNNIDALDVTNNLALEEIYCSANEMNELDVAGCQAIRSISCEDNNLSELDLSQNTAIEYLFCANNNLSELDLSQNTALSVLSCNNNNLRELDLSQNTALEHLDCTENNLSRLDVSHNNALIDLECARNKLTYLNISGSEYMDIFNCRYNSLKFSSIIGANNVGDYMHGYYMFQSDVGIPETTEVNASIDLSSEYMIDGIITEYKWYYGDDNSVVVKDVSASDVTYSDLIPDGIVEAIPTTAENGVFTFDSDFVGEKLFCVLTNECFPDLLITTTVTEIIEAPLDLGEPQITLVHSPMDPGHASLSLSFVAGDTVYVDWGDGNIIEYSREGVRGDAFNGNTTVKIYCSSGITEFDCSENYERLMDLDVSNCPTLEVLNCSSNTYVGELDVSKNTNLKKLTCIEAGVTSLNVSGCTKLEYLNCDYNSISELDVSDCVALELLGCGMNNISELDVSGCSSLKTLGVNDNPLKVLKASYCALTSLDLTMVSPLEELECTGNNLTELNVSFNNKLKNLNCSENPISALDISGCTSLLTVDCSSTNLTTLDTSKNTKLETIHCGYSQLTALDLSNNTLLTFVDCPYNQISELKLNGNSAITHFFCNDNKVASLDLSGMTLLNTLDCSNNNLSELDVSDCADIVELNCAWNKICELDLSNNTKLIDLRCYGNAIESLDLSNNTALCSLMCHINKLRFSTMSTNIPTIECPEEPAYATRYDSQANIEIDSSMDAGEEIDLSSEYDIDGTNTVYTWYNAANDSVVTPTTSANGVFTFGEELVGESLYCTMTNTVFPDLTLTTTNVEITEAANDEENEVSDSDFTVEDENGYVGDVEVDEDTTFVDKDGKRHHIGKLKLVVGNVDKKDHDHVLGELEKFYDGFDRHKHHYVMYDISLRDHNNVEVDKIDGRIRICLKHPKEVGENYKKYDFHLFHLRKHHGYEKVNITVDSSGIWFYADEFSPFVLVYNLKTQIDSEVQGDSDSADPETGDDSNNITAAIVLTSSFTLMAACAVSGVVIYKKKRKAEK